MYFVIFVFGLVVAVWLGLLWWIRKTTLKVIDELAAAARERGETIRLSPQVAVFRGADSEFGNIKGTGAIILTSRKLTFRKLTGQVIEIDVADIVKTYVSKSFKGAVSLGTGGEHLVVETGNGNRIGFLLRDTRKWAAMLN